MYIEVKPTVPPTVQEPDDFRRLSIIANTSQSPTAIVDALVSVKLAAPDSTPEAVRLDVTALRDTARAALKATPSPEWESSFASMLDYAQLKGWYQPDTGTVAAHIEWMDTAR
ncbi:hypothetical protein ACWDUD_24220 [Rhodococcus sp. NPDC003382]|uniref:hypothetical protein n=1 Tax=Rhodococcus zopfii TaxID=43772 RepID=UPI0009337A87|nr:hypothetical protein [Rhodococcus zopfii]